MGEISAELSQGKQILEERNKHILLAENMVGTQSEDEKRIKQAIKEGKQLKNEKAAEAVQFKPKQK